ncbi:MAG: YHS domain-containing protein [Nitrososphaeraceae archaeon]
MARDHVCSMHVEENTPFVTEYEKSKYYCCSEACKMSFDSNPQKYDDMAKKFSDDIENIVISGDIPSNWCISYR